MTTNSLLTDKHLLGSLEEGRVGVVGSLTPSYTLHRYSEIYYDVFLNPITLLLWALRVTKIYSKKNLILGTF